MAKRRRKPPVTRAVGVRESREEREARQLLEDGLVAHLGTQEEGEWPEPVRVLGRGQLQGLLDAEREDSKRPKPLGGWLKLSPSEQRKILREEIGDPDQ